MISIRELHLLAFGERVAGWYDEAVAIWRDAYGQPDDPPVLLLARGGYSGYGKSLADAGPTPLDGRLTRHLIRLFSNAQTQGHMSDQQFRRDLITHELGHVYELMVLQTIRADSSTHDSKSWRKVCTTATPYALPELTEAAAKIGVTLAQVFGAKASRVQRVNRIVTRIRQAGALTVEQLASWPHLFRTPEGHAAFIEACRAVTTQQQRNAPSKQATEGSA